MEALLRNVISFIIERLYEVVPYKQLVAELKASYGLSNRQIDMILGALVGAGIIFAEKKGNIIYFMSARKPSEQDLAVLIYRLCKIL